MLKGIKCTEFKLSGVTFGLIAAAMAVVCALVLAMSDQKIEIQLLLAAALGASVTATIALGAQAMQSDPPNHHAEANRHAEEMERIKLDHEFRSQ